MVYTQPKFYRVLEFGTGTEVNFQIFFFFLITPRCAYVRTKMQY